MIKKVFKIIDVCILAGIVQTEQICYVLATVHHETGRTFKPVKEAFWLSENWRKNNLRYYPYYGRGFSQITWETNYQKFENLFNIPLVQNPNLALEFETAVKILTIGMRDGMFTGRKLSHYINSNKIDYKNARRIINSKDKAGHVASLAEGYYFLVDLYKTEGSLNES